ncbi:MAG: hypothetical protein M1479_02945 [Actinobacteria bacterium]|nr:hypothetical protein [Cyanobacteriota bacterium]MCL5771214.1 hypothetical protein [Actinomycetota bacterium]
MKKTINIKKILISILILILAIAIVPLSTSCKKETIFGNLTLCQSLNKDTFEPVNPTNEFDLFSKEIAAAINIQNVKGTDSYRFLWKNEQTGGVIGDINGKYKEGETRYGSGWFSSTLTVGEGKDAIALPGNYILEFYHNNELKSSAKFTIKEPEAKILNVFLASETNEKAEPVKTTQEFNSGGVVYACVQINYLIKGNKLSAKWYDEKGNLINETPIDISNSFYKTSWVSFSLESINNKPLPEGKYKVEIYYNDVKYNEFPFTVIVAEGQAETSSVTFDKKNTFTEAKDKYYFTIKYPDSNKYTFKEDTSGMNVVFEPINKNEAYSTMMIVLNEGSAPSAADYGSFADEIANQSSQGMKQNGDNTEADRKLVDGTVYKEYIYYFTDKDNNEFGLILGFIPKFGKLYIWYGFAHKTFYNQLNSSYYGSLASLVLKK